MTTPSATFAVLLRDAAERRATRCRLCGGELGRHPAVLEVDHPEGGQERVYLCCGCNLAYPTDEALGVAVARAIGDNR